MTFSIIQNNTSQKYYLHQTFQLLSAVLISGDVQNKVSSHFKSSKEIKECQCNQEATVGRTMETEHNG